VPPIINMTSKPTVTPEAGDLVIDTDDVLSTPPKLVTAVNPCTSSATLVFQGQDSPVLWNIRIIVHPLESVL